VSYYVTISPREASTGITIQFQYVADQFCEFCDGSGVASGEWLESCPECGSSEFDINCNDCDYYGPGKYSCPECDGEDLLVWCKECEWYRSNSEECVECSGAGRMQNEHSIQVKLPAGTKNGAKLRIKGKGSVGRDGGDHGDLYIIVTYSERENFHRNYQIVGSDSAALRKDKTGDPTRARANRREDWRENILEPLLQVARPDLYRTNAFRILGLSVHATDRDLKKESEKLQMLEKFGGGGPLALNGKPLPLEPSPDPDTTRNSMQRLRKPEQRLVDEFFWLWPQDGGAVNGQALVALKSNDLTAAVKAWEHAEKLPGDDGIPTHNLAILSHTVALDLEYLSHSKALTNDQKALRDVNWRRALAKWNEVLKSEAFWGRLNARIHELDNPLLTVGVARRLRLTLPLVLLSINAQLALRAAERGPLKDVEYHLWLMRNSGFEEEVVEEALKRTVQPVRERVSALCQSAEKEADADPKQGDKVTRRLVEQTKPLLTVLDAVLPFGYSIRNDAHDEVVMTALSCQIPYGNETENWKVSLELLELVQPLAVSDSTRQRIAENLKTVKENQKYKELLSCWFCHENESDTKAEIEVKMYGNVTRTRQYNSTRVEWQNAVVTVRRCLQCQSVHEKTSRYRFRGVGLGLLFGILIDTLVLLLIGSAEVVDGWILGGALVILAVSVGLGCDIASKLDSISTPPGIEPRGHIVDAPGVEKLRSEGWVIGERPSS